MPQSNRVRITCNLFGWIGKQGEGELLEGVARTQHYVLYKRHSIPYIQVMGDTAMTDLTNPIFNDADAAREHLEATRWPNGPVCPHCEAKSHRVTKVEGTKKTHRKGLYACNDCSGQFTVTVGTVLEQSHVPLNKWLLAFYLMCGSKKGISAHQLHRSIKVSYKTAWFMGHRIREAMRAGGLTEPMGGKGGIVEVDETYFGKTEEVRNRSTRPNFSRNALSTRRTISNKSINGYLRR